MTPRAMKAIREACEVMPMTMALIPAAIVFFGGVIIFCVSMGYM
jgi:hypothetical protein